MPEHIDQLSYNYTGNQLTLVTDAKNNPSGFPARSTSNNVYDSNGNMTQNPSENIYGIVYNYLNLPNKVSIQAPQILYTYRADGTKVKKFNGYVTTDYLDGFQYTTAVNTSVANLQFIPTAEGYYDFTKNAYIYNYIDHLGNVRLSYTKNSSTGVPLTVDQSDYYPFGLKQASSATSSANTEYNYKYNGKELQETGMYDYGARIYMPDIGRWGVVDPLAEQYRRWSPYSYAVNNPIRFTDPDGRGVLTDFYNLKGQLTKHVEDGKTDKKIVLTTSKKEVDTDAAISNGNVVNQISNDQVKQIDDIYTFGKTDKTGTEKGFSFGQNGNSSKTVTGAKAGEVGSKEWAESRKDLREKGDKTASDAHLHPLQYDSDGNVTSYGLPTPSDTDKDPKNMSNNTQPSMVLGWTENTGSVPSGQIGGTPPPSTYSPTVGFYNTSGSIITVDYSAFKKAMEKVNK
ncbi:RHS repeat-associated core domain-containing protein [Halpernia sp. GG3]